MKEDGDAVLPPVPAVVSFRVKAGGYVLNRGSGTPVSSSLQPAWPLKDGALQENIWDDDWGNGPIYAHSINDTELASKTKLIQLATGGQTRVEWDSPDMSASTSFAAGTTHNGIGQSADANVSLAAAHDNRKIWISRPGAVGERIVNGVPHSDARYSFWDYTGQTLSGYEDKQKWVQLQSNFEGDWYGNSNPDVLWKWNPEGGVTLFDPDSQAKTDQKMPYGPKDRDSAGAWGATSRAGTPDTSRTVTLTATDIYHDEAEANAQYVLHFHDEWQNWRSDPERETDRITRKMPEFPTRSDWFGDENVDVVGTWNTIREVGFEEGVEVSDTFGISDFIQFGVAFSDSSSESVTEDTGIETTAPAGQMIRRVVEQSWIR